MKTPFFLEKIERAKIAHRKSIAEARVFGVSYVAYGGIVFTIDGPQEVAINNYPPGWIEHYLSSKYIDCDPAISHALSSPIPAVWTPKMFSGSIAARHLLYDVVSAGMRGGITIPVFDHLGNKGSVNFAIAERETASFWDCQRIAALHIVAVHLHHALVREYSVHQYPCGIELTIREKEVLSLLASGYSERKIAMQLGITTSTVEYHSKNIREKLSATNTVQAVYKAAQLSLIGLLVNAPPQNVNAEHYMSASSGLNNQQQYKIPQMQSVFV